MLLKDLTSSDSATRSNAYSYLRYYQFEKADARLLYEAVQKSYPDDTSDYWNTKYKLISQLGRLKDPGFNAFTEKVYPSLSEKTRLACLQALLENSNSASTDLFLKLTQEKKPDVDRIPFGFFNTLYDSLELAATLLPRMFFLYEGKAFRGEIYALAKELLDSNKLSKEFITEEIRKKIIDLNCTDLDRFTYEDSVYCYTSYQNVTAAIELLRHYIKEPAVTERIRTLVDSRNEVISLLAVKALIENNLDVSPAQLEKIASSSRQRLNLYIFLIEQGKPNLFPSRWLKQNYFAESDMLNTIQNYDIYPDSIVLLVNKTASYKGTKCRFYLFKFKYTTYEGDVIWEAGLSGPHPLDKKKVITSGAASRLGYETFESKSINEHFITLLRTAELEEVQE